MSKRKVQLKQIDHKGQVIDTHNIKGTTALTDAGLKIDFDGIHTSYTALINAVQADVNQNEADADAAIAALQADVDQNEADADAAIAALQADVDQNEADADAAIAAEQAARIAADGVLDGKITAETAARIAADNGLDSRLQVLEADPTTKTYVDSQITSTLASEMTFRGGIDLTAPNLLQGVTLGKGDMFVVTVGGSFEGAQFAPGDMIIADRANAQMGQSPSEFVGVQKNFDLSTYSTTAQVQAMVNAVQADVDQNEADADSAIAALQADVDQNEADADAAIAAEQAARVAQDNKIEQSCGLDASGNLVWGNAPEHQIVSSSSSIVEGSKKLAEEIEALKGFNDGENRAMNFYAEGKVTAAEESSKVQVVFGAPGSTYTNTDNTNKDALNLEGRKTLNSFHFEDKQNPGSYILPVGKLQVLLNGVMLQGHSNLTTDDYRIIGDNAAAPNSEKVQGFNYQTGSGNTQLSFFYIEFAEGLVAKDDVIMVYTSFSDFV